MAAPCVIEGWSQRIGALNRAQARAVSIAVLAEFLSLLTSFLGWGLTRRFLSNVWPDLAFPRE